MMVCRNVNLKEIDNRERKRRKKKVKERKKKSLIVSQKNRFFGEFLNFYTKKKGKEERQKKKWKNKKMKRERKREERTTEFLHASIRKLFKSSFKESSKSFLNIVLKEESVSLQFLFFLYLSPSTSRILKK